MYSAAGRHPARAPGPGGLLCARRASPLYPPLCVVTSFPVSGGCVRCCSHAPQVLRPQGPQAPPPLRHESRHGQPPEAPPVSCLMRPTTRRSQRPTHAARGAAVCGPSPLRHPPPRSQHHHQPRPPLLKAPPRSGPSFAQAAATHRLRTTSAPSASIAAHRSFAEPHSLFASAPASRGLRPSGSLAAGYLAPLGSASECCGLGRKAAMSASVVRGRGVLAVLVPCCARCKASSP